jgi:hypothetical protein
MVIMILFTHTLLQRLDTCFICLSKASLADSRPSSSASSQSSSCVYPLRVSFSQSGCVRWIGSSGARRPGVRRRRKRREGGRRRKGSGQEWAYRSMAERCRGSTTTSAKHHYRRTTHRHSHLVARLQPSEQRFRRWQGTIVICKRRSHPCQRCDVPF